MDVFHKLAQTFIDLNRTCARRSIVGGEEVTHKEGILKCRFNNLPNRQTAFSVQTQGMLLLS